MKIVHHGKKIYFAFVLERWELNTELIWLRDEVTDKVTLIYYLCLWKGRLPNQMNAHGFGLYFGWPVWKMEASYRAPIRLHKVTRRDVYF